MKNIGFIGLGKLGLPVAAAMSVKLNSKIVGFDKNPRISQYVLEKKVPYQELRSDEFLSKANISVASCIDDVVSNSDVIFCAVQTPHEPRFEGISPVPEVTADFDYSFLCAALEEVAHSAKKLDRNLTVVVISTILPGTFRKKVLPIFSNLRNVGLVYNPFFIAMGTTIDDFLDPEFVLMGSDDIVAMEKLESLYTQIHNSPVVKMKVESAELTKVAYNTFIGFKIVFANTCGEILQNLGRGSVDEVSKALSLANKRIISNKYLNAGMADGGGCHPRDQIAMSHLAKELHLSHNIFDELARARDQQTLGQARLIRDFSAESKLPVVLLGEAYKPNIGLTIGSPALLLSYFLNELGVAHTSFDPFTSNDLTFKETKFGPSVFFLATNHEIFRNFSVPDESILIDPWGFWEGVAINFKLVTPGRN